MNAVAKEKPASHKLEKIYTTDPLADVAPETRERVNQLVDYIMKNCLWQFNSRAWDRRKQNAGIIGKATQILCDEPVENQTLQERCYWVDAVCLVEAYRKRHPWLAALDQQVIRSLMRKMHERLDWLTIDGSLNEELTVQHY